MPYSVEITQESTGEVRQYERAEDWDWFRWQLWSTGNFSCDCNRELEFIRMGGSEPTDEDFEKDACGEGAYAVRVKLEGRDWVDVEDDSLYVEREVT